MDEMDKVLYQYCEIFCSHQWLSYKFLLFTKRIKTGRSPVSFLFIIVIEGLNDMLRIAQEKLWLRGFRVSNRVGVTWRSHTYNMLMILCFFEMPIEIN